MGTHRSGSEYRPRRNEQGERIYRVHATKADFAGSHKLTVPVPLARRIGPDAEFTLHLTDEGLLYRFASGSVSPRPPLPAWLEV